MVHWGCGVWVRDGCIGAVRCGSHILRFGLRGSNIEAVYNCGLKKIKKEGGLTWAGVVVEGLSGCIAADGVFKGYRYMSRIRQMHALHAFIISTGVMAMLQGSYGLITCLGVYKRGTNLGGMMVDARHAGRETREAHTPTAYLDIDMKEQRRLRIMHHETAQRVYQRGSTTQQHKGVRMDTCRIEDGNQEQTNHGPMTPTRWDTYRASTYIH
eukprot:3281499-Pyramimonas_sp.AAC.1